MPTNFTVVPVEDAEGGGSGGARAAEAPVEAAEEPPQARDSGTAAAPVLLGKECLSHACARAQALLTPR